MLNNTDRKYEERAEWRRGKGREMMAKRRDHKRIV